MGRSNYCQFGRTKCSTMADLYWQWPRLYTQMKTAFNVSLLLQEAMDVVAGLVESNVLVNGSLNASNQTDGDERVIGSLLMPVWAYQSAAAYLVFISVVGLFMNVLVIIVILNDPVVDILITCLDVLSFLCFLLFSIVFDCCLDRKTTENDGTQLDVA